MKTMDMRENSKTIIRFLMLLIVVLTGCTGKERKESKQEPETKTEKLRIYLYEDFPMQKAEMIRDEMAKYFPEVEIMSDRLPLPTDAFVARRNRYRGTGLLDDLKSRRNGNTVLALTEKVICTKNNISQDFGIMGISYLDSRMAVVSTTIPKTGKKQSDSNLVKLTLHELGHAYGLPHCPDQKCYMVDAEHRMKLPHTTGFCNSCRTRLRSKGVHM